MILERALEIQKELEVLAEERSKIIVKKNKLDDEMMAIGKGYVFNYEYQYTVTCKTIESKSSFLNKSLKLGDEVFTINRIMKNYDEYKIYYGLFKSIQPFVNKSVWSVTYYRRFGVLLRCGGGHLILNDEVLCSDEEWKELIKGNINKFLK